jgi:hypothetical protein
LAAGLHTRIYWYDRHLNIPEIMAIYIMPLVAIFFGMGALLFLVFRVLKLGSTMRDAFIALFTGFILTYFTLTVIGAAFRGKGQQLVPPTRVPNLEEYPNIMRQTSPPSEYALIDAREHKDT